jgi:shikimate kinase
VVEIRAVKVSINGGISVLSAFSNWIGGSASIELPMEIVMSRSDSPPENRIVNDTVSYLAGRLKMDRNYSVEVKSKIPVSAGLKSSSALTLGVLLGMISLNEYQADNLEILKLADLASISNGTSLTGAFDDLCSCFFGGYCITDNRKMEILKKGELPDRSVIIAYPIDNHRITSGISMEKFSRYSGCFDQISRQALDGNIFQAMDMNGFIMGSILGIDLRAIGSLLNLGCVHASQSGKGPALFGIFDEDIPERIDLPSVYGLIRTRFSNRKASVVEVT